MSEWKRKKTQFIIHETGVAQKLVNLMKVIFITPVIRLIFIFVFGDREKRLK